MYVKSFEFRYPRQNTHIIDEMPNNTNSKSGNGGYKSKWPKKKGQSKKKTGSFYKKAARKGVISVPTGPTARQAWVRLKVTGFIEVSIDATGQYNEVDIIANFLDPGAPSSFFSQQPVGFDQWSAMFQRFTVSSSAIKLSAMRQVGSSATTGGLASATVIPSTMTLAQMRQAQDGGATTGQGTFCSLQDDALAKTKYFSRLDANADLIEIEHFIKTKALFPDKEPRTDPEFSGTTASNTAGLTSPVKQAYWYLIIQQNQAATAITNVTGYSCRVTIDYWTLFSSPVNVYDV